jgi:hypothetical protein
VRCAGRARYDDGVDERASRLPGPEDGVGSETTGTDQHPELHDLWRVWVTPTERKRCTYVTRDEQPVAAVAGRENRVVRL